MSEIDQTHQNVRDYYAKKALSTGSCCDPVASKSCCAPTESGIPAEITSGSLGCGDPVSPARLQPGETVLDLGSGGGLDCFRATQVVGPQGHVIGVDMTPEMIEKARRNAARLSLASVEFRQGYLEALPVEDNSVDVIISNCVINLAPDKAPVFREMFRALKPGGRVSVADIVVSGALPVEVQSSDEAWCACVSGALTAEEYVSGLKAAGFIQVGVQPEGAVEGEIVKPLADVPFSAHISAVKPAA